MVSSLQQREPDSTNHLVTQHSAHTVVSEQLTCTLRIQRAVEGNHLSSEACAGHQGATQGHVHRGRHRATGEVDCPGLLQGCSCQLEPAWSQGWVEEQGDSQAEADFTVPTGGWGGQRSSHQPHLPRCMPFLSHFVLVAFRAQVLGQGW